MILVEKTGLVSGTLIQRYKRFLADVRLDDGCVVTAHCTNTGTMATCWETGGPVLLEHCGEPGPQAAVHLVGLWRGRGLGGGGDRHAQPGGGRGGAAGCAAGSAGPSWGPDGGEIRGREQPHRRAGLGRRGSPACFIEVKNTTLKAGAWALLPGRHHGTRHQAPAGTAGHGEGRPPGGHRVLRAPARMWTGSTPRGRSIPPMPLNWTAPRRTG